MNDSNWRRTSSTDTLHRRATSFNETLEGPSGCKDPLESVQPVTSTHPSSSFPWLCMYFALPSSNVRPFAKTADTLLLVTLPANGRERAIRWYDRRHACQAMIRNSRVAALTPACSRQTTDVAAMQHHWDAHVKSGPPWGSNNAFCTLTSSNYIIESSTMHFVFHSVASLSCIY